MSESERFWESLLLALTDPNHMVVPIIGRDLVTASTAGREVPYHCLLAGQVARRLEIPEADLPLDADLQYIEGTPQGRVAGARMIRMYASTIHKELSHTVAPGEALRLLADIPAFKLFTTTTWDDLLERAIEGARGHAPATGAFEWKPAGTLEYKQAATAESLPFVCHLLGRIQAIYPFGMTEREVLEYVHALTAARTAWRGLSEKLAESHLLFLGLNVPDWLTRFMMKLARPEPLWHQGGGLEFVVDTGMLDPTFLRFLRGLSRDPQVHSFESELAFVRELHARWFRQHPRPTGAATADQAEASIAAERLEESRDGAVFISYASEDREAAERFAEALVAAGLEVWLDRRQLRAGDEYDPIISRAIKRAAAFVPLLSRHTERNDRAYRREWNDAFEKARNYFGHPRGFIYSVIVDGTPASQIRNVPEATFKRNVASAPGGKPAPDLIAVLNDAQREDVLRRAGR